MRYFQVIYFILILCGCSVEKRSRQPDINEELLRFPEYRTDTALMRERQQKIQAELDYYLQRHNVQDEGFDIVVRYAQEGDSTMATYLPQGHITLFNTLCHHNGKGLMRDVHGRLVIGLFQADTLCSGIRLDKTGIYAGTLNRRAEAWGHGSYRATDGSYYEGHWEHDQREGFGLSIAPTHLKAGIWQYGQFRGEHMSYHSERIYGIDISRHQHEKRGRRLPFDWRNLRITHLGRRISQQQVLDRVDYPVSFVYIKSTEGTTIENRYYDDDYASAHQKGIPTGAYHFFSTKTPADEQAAHFLSNTHFRRGDMPPMLDIEPSPEQIEQMGGPLVLFDAMRTWLNAVERATSTRPIIYINQNFVNTYLDLAPDIKAGYTLWIARYGEYKPDIHLALWQLSADGRVQGITGDVDLNVFNGYQGHWEEFLREATVK